MATANKGVQQKETSSSSVPSRRNNNAHRRYIIRIPQQIDRLPMIPENPIPNYLKPTISSSHATGSQSPKKQKQTLECYAQPFAAARPRIPINKAQPPSSLSKSWVTAISSKERATRTRSSSITNLSPKPSLAKAPKAPAPGKALPLNRARTHSKITAMSEKRETESTTLAAISDKEEKVVDIVRGTEAQKQGKGLEVESKGWSEGSRAGRRMMKRKNKDDVDRVRLRMSKLRRALGADTRI